MGKPGRAGSGPVKAMRMLALRYPETREGIACAGTVLEERTIQVKGKVFLFLGVADAMVKLRDSLAEASALSRKEPDRYQAGGQGWVRVKLRDDDSTPPEPMARWIEESYRLMAPVKLVASLPGPAGPGSPAKMTARKPSRR